MRKRSIALALCLLLCAFPLTACADAARQPEESGGKIEVVATVFPLYDWARELLRGTEGVELRLLLDKGVDMHSFQPGAADIIAVTGCGLLVYVGGESEEWVDRAVAEAGAQGRALKLTEVLDGSLRTEEYVEGMQAEAGEDAAFDEHVWLSLRNARTAVSALAERLAGLDAAEGERIAANAAAYLARLDALDGRYRDVLSDSAHHTLLVADRFPFRYLAEDYGLDYYAAFPGCSAETEASFETVVFLAEKLDELGLGAVLYLETGDGALARTVAAASRRPDAALLRLDSMQAAGPERLASGEGYLDAMGKNLEVLKEALA